jgi:hypothetical protein
LEAREWSSLPQGQHADDIAILLGFGIGDILAVGKLIGQIAVEL